MKATTQQELILFRLLDTAGDTQYGKKYHFDNIRTYDTFSERVPITFYKNLEPYIEKIKEGEIDVLWPGKTDKFAVSAGTTGKGKHLPMTDERIACDRVFMREVALNYFKNRPNLFGILGKHLSLPGSLEKKNGYLLGEVSGFSALHTPYWLRKLQLEDPARLTELPFDQKFELLLNKALNANLKVITAVPSWILTFFQQALEMTGKKSIAEIWPKLQLLVCGGVKLANYKPHLLKLMGGMQPDFIETYGASEAYIAYTDDPQRTDLKLVPENWVFYEFIPDPLPDEDALSIQDAVPLWGVEKNVPYAVVVSTSAGLWRYALRDVVEFTSLEPPRIEVKGRVSEMLDDFGEGLYIFEAEEALEKVCNEMDLSKGEFTIAPRLLSEKEMPYHHWMLQFPEPIHRQTLERLAQGIDGHLQKVNRHYAIRRDSGALAAPKMSSISQQDINRWMEACDKTKAQSKLPRVLRNNVDVLL